MSSSGNLIPKRRWVKQKLVQNQLVSLRGSNLSIPKEPEGNLDNFWCFILVLEQNEPGAHCQAPGRGSSKTSIHRVISGQCCLSVCLI